MLGDCGNTQVEVLGKVGDGAVAVDNVVCEDALLDECILAAVSDSISKVVLHIFKIFFFSVQIYIKDFNLLLLFVYN